MKKGLLHLTLTALVVGLAIFGMKRCSPPPPPPGDMTRPGNDGGQRPPRVDREVSVTINPRGNSFANPELSVLACGTPYKIMTTASENPSTCAGYDFSRLIGMAEAPFLRRYMQLSCPEDCGPLSLRRTYVKYDCTGNKATVATKVELLCPNPGQTHDGERLNPGSLPVRASTEAVAAGENGDFSPPARRGELVTDLSLGATMSFTLNCPQTRTFSMRYEENEPGRCASFNNYQPYVARAVNQAETRFYAPIGCPAGCAKQPFATVRREWACDANTSNVVVKLWFNVECR